MAQPRRNSVHAKINLKDARPKKGFECYVGSDGDPSVITFNEIEISDWTWLEDVKEEGDAYELGPCYWRATSRGFYSTICHRGEIYLVIYPEWDGNFETCVLPELAVRKYFG
jgi:hypothetical protein